MRSFAPTALLAALLAAASPASFAAEPSPRTVQVTGNGEVRVSPNKADISMNVNALAKDLRDAETKVNTVVRNYLKEARALGATEADISTAGYSANPEYEWQKDRQVFKGYRVNREIQVRVSDLDKLGDFLLRATAAGVNQVNPPVLGHKDHKALEREALALATKEARAKAEVIAGALGMRLGGALSVSSSGGYQPPPMMPKVMMMRAESADAAPPSGNEVMGFSGGQVVATSDVNVSFELLAQ